MWAAEDSLMSLHEAGKKTKLKKKKKNFTRRHIAEYSRQLSRRVQRRIVPQIKRAALEHFISDYILGRGHSFISDIYSWNPPPNPPKTLPSQRPLGSQSALRPHQPLWKNPVHLTCIDWLHLCVLFGPCRWRRRAGQLPAAAPRPI